MSNLKVDLTNCNRESIHIPGNIQPHGFLIAINRSGSDLIDNGTSLVLSSFGAIATLVSDGVSKWTVAVLQNSGTSSSGGQNVRVTSTATLGISTVIVTSAAPTVTAGTEILTNAGAQTGGTGTVSTTIGSPNPNVTGSGTAFSTQLKVGYLISIAGEIHRIISISSNTSLAVDANWGAANTNVAFLYQVPALMITPTSTGSQIRVRAIVYGAMSLAATMSTISLFSIIGASTTLIGVAAAAYSDGGGKVFQTMMLESVFTSGTTSPITLMLRCGPNSNTFLLNSTNTGGAFYGGTLKSSIEAWEELA